MCRCLEILNKGTMMTGLFYDSVTLLYEIKDGLYLKVMSLTRVLVNDMSKICNKK